MQIFQLCRGGAKRILPGMKLNAPNFENPWLRAISVGTPELPYDEAFQNMVRSSGAEEAMWKWLPRISGGGSSFESYSQHVMKLTNTKKFYPMICFRKSDNGFVGGGAFIRPSRTHRTVEIGFVWLNEAFRKWVYFAALQELMVRRASDWGAKRIVWYVAPANERMIRSLTRLGAMSEGQLRSVYRMNDGRWSDMVVFSLVQDEIKEALERVCKDLEADF